MVQNKKIGLLLALGTNYGALLQSYATQQFLLKMGFETSVIIYKGRKRDLFRQGLTGIIFYIVHHFKRNTDKRPKQQLNTIHTINLKNRIKVQKEFIRTRFINIVTFTDHSKLVHYASLLDAVVIGSDQSWLPGSMISTKASLEFVPKGVRRVSYATSLGVSEYPHYCWRQARKVWKKMDYISVREEQGKRIINDICGNIPVQVVCDPTYLFTQTEWEQLIPRKCLEEEKYILCYFLGTDRKLFEIARNFADVMNLKLLSILTCEVAIEGDDSFPDRLITGATPDEFVNYIRCADFVLTDSFHGLAFSVINKKQFYLFFPQREYLSQSRNSRLENIVKMWGLEDRLITDKSIDWKDYKVVDIDYDVVTKKVDAKRAESILYLNTALHFND